MARYTFLLMICFFVSLHSIENITIGFTGDVMIGRGVNEVLQTKPCEFMWGNVLALLKANTFNIANLETALTTSIYKIPKVFNYKSDPKNTQCLKLANIKLVNLANNHSLDFGIDGLQETIKTLQEHNILFVGAGMNLEHAQKPAIISIGDLKIGVIGCTDNEPDWAADSNKPGINYVAVGDIDTLKKQIEKVKPLVDVLIISFHWGPNWPIESSKEMQTFAHQIIDAGADIIHGHSAHITLGIEIYKEKLIMYSTGDFVDDYAIDPIRRNDYSFLYNVTLSGTKIIKIHLIPVLLTYAQVNVAPKKDTERMLKIVQEQSKKLGTELNKHGIWQK